MCFLSKLVILCLQGVYTEVHYLVLEYMASSSYVAMSASNKQSQKLNTPRKRISMWRQMELIWTIFCRQK